MKKIILAASMFLAASCSEPTPSSDTAEPRPDRPELVTIEDRFAVLALDCIHREYPNLIHHVMQSDDDVNSPRELTPVFYGCFDWHSSVHGHWLLTRLLSTDPGGVLSDEIRAELSESFTESNFAGELAYYSAEGRTSFERPYGIAWYLQLVAELEESDDPQMQQWREILRPLENAIVAKVRAWLPKLSYPVHLGTHNQTAFAFGLMIDYARTVGDADFEAELVAKTLAFHQDDVNCPLAYEPSGEDFLSACLMEADLMRRVFFVARRLLDLVGEFSAANSG